MSVNTFSIADLLRRCSRYFPEKTFLVFEDKRITYREVEERVNRLCNGLMRKGLKKGDHVAIIFPNCPQFIECFFAIIKAGSIAIPLNIRLSPREFSYQINQCDATMLIYDSQFAGIVDSIRSQLSRVKVFITDAEMVSPDTFKYEDLITGSPDNDPNIDIELNDGCVMYFTAGTTGEPKPAYRTHLNALATAQIATLTRTSSDKAVWLGFPPWFHIAGWECLVLPVLLTGITLVTSNSFDPAKALEYIEKEKVTTAILVPAMSVMILNLPDLEKYDRSSMKFYISGTAPTPVTLQRKIMKYFPNATYQAGYGMTEVGLIAHIDHADALRKELSAGYPVYSTRMRVVDDNDNDISVGEIGEVIVQGPQVSREYYNDPEKTAETIKGGWFHTGDLGRLDDEGYLYLVDRKKDMICSGSENVYSAEVENVLYNNPKVLEAAAIGLPDEKWGERVTAVVVLKSGEQMSEQELIDFCRANLSHYKCPRQVIFLNEPLPRTGAGKVLKRELRQRFVTS